MTDFGRDLYCLDSIQTGRLASGLLLLGQRCYHRLITPKGACRGSAGALDAGIDLPGMVGASNTVELQNAMPTRIANELLKEEQVEAVTVDMESEVDGPDVSWTFTILVQSAQGPFRLVLAVADVTVELLQLEGVTL